MSNALITYGESGGSSALLTRGETGGSGMTRKACKCGHLVLLKHAEERQPSVPTALHCYVPAGQGQYWD